MSTVKEIAEQLKRDNSPINLIYAFNSTGKTQLSVEYKNITKNENGDHTGVYFNAYSEDLFVWDNENLRLKIKVSSLNPYFSNIIENRDLLDDKLAQYMPSYNYKFDENDNSEIGINAIHFYRDHDIKISRGEERIFIWCFFLALFDTDAWTSDKESHIFIDDPVSSLDEHNVYITADSIVNLIDSKIKNTGKRLIVTTHHIGLFSILSDRLMYSSYKNLTKRNTLNIQNNELTLKNHDKDVFLYHLYLMQLLDHCIVGKEVKRYQFILLRQILEIISSFLGYPGIKPALKEIGISDVDIVSNQVNSLSHIDGRMISAELNQIDIDLLVSIYKKIQDKYNFRTHTS